MLKHLGLILILVGWALAIVLIFKWRNKDLRTISSHGASSKRASLLFTAVLIGLGVPFYYWILFWLVPYLQLGLSFKVVITLALIFNIVTAFTTDTGTKSKTIHRTAAFIMFILFIIMSFMIINAPVISSTAQIIGMVMLIYIFVSALVVRFTQFGRRHSLIFESLFIFSVHFIILSAVYL